MVARILVVDDEPLVAWDMYDLLRGAGLEVLEPTFSLRCAVKIVNDGGCELAVLDMWLGWESSLPLAETLLEKSLPFVITSGKCDLSEIPMFGGAPFFGKPVNRRALIAMMRSYTRDLDAQSSSAA